MTNTWVKETLKVKHTQLREQATDQIIKSRSERQLSFSNQRTRQYLHSWTAPKMPTPWPVPWR